ncbi:hypothetical protein GWC77_23435 [Paraburkholderia sp. NMBU_R16]|uniref:hypothetical protein n=1 Tax=Paraburkholderia sp. NMBU_R16 TaxID=2698676 RepID=UPI001564A31E|nr:hypothetical protein [Paraburkholderia sp. NMBU_R16]NRO98867.1 hypothetical protein [Paraburkholderia sp. NMBU_R16]
MTTRVSGNNDAHTSQTADDVSQQEQHTNAQVHHAQMRRRLTKARTSKHNRLLHDQQVAFHRGVKYATVLRPRKSTVTHHKLFRHLGKDRGEKESAHESHAHEHEFHEHLHHLHPHHEESCREDRGGQGQGQGDHEREHGQDSERDEDSGQARKRWKVIGRARARESKSTNRLQVVADEHLDSPHLPQVLMNEFVRVLQDITEAPATPPEVRASIRLLTVPLLLSFRSIKDTGPGARQRIPRMLALRSTAQVLRGNNPSAGTAAVDILNCLIDASLAKQRHAPDFADQEWPLERLRQCLVDATQGDDRHDR